jgi:hypothetical protein
VASWAQAGQPDGCGGSVGEESEVDEPAIEVFDAEVAKQPTARDQRADLLGRVNAGGAQAQKVGQVARVVKRVDECAVVVLLLEDIVEQVVEVALVCDVLVLGGRKAPFDGEDLGQGALHPTSEPAGVGPRAIGASVTVGVDLAEDEQPELFSVGEHHTSKRSPLGWGPGDHAVIFRAKHDVLSDGTHVWVIGSRSGSVA